MAFMMPVMKNNYDIYKDTRNRKHSEGSNSNSNSSGVAPVLSANNGRVRKVSECKSESFATSPSHQDYNPYRVQIPRTQSHRGFTRNPSRTSNSTGAFSPSRSFCQQASISPPKRAYNVSSSVSNTEANNDVSKFHQRLVDKLRKSFGKDSSKRS